MYPGAVWLQQLHKLKTLGDRRFGGGRRRYGDDHVHKSNTWPAGLAAVTAVAASEGATELRLAVEAQLRP